MTRTLGLLIVAALLAAVTAGAAGAHGVGASPLDGTWKWSWTRAELLDADILGRDADALAGRHTATFVNGRVTGRNLTNGVVLRATFSVHGNLVGFVFATRGPGIVPGRTYQLKWSIYRDRLEFSELPGRSVLTALPIKPWIRVR